MYDLDKQHRCFLSIIPSDELRAEIRDINRKFKKFARNLKFVPLDQIHLTLQFLGNNVSGESLSQIVESVDDYINNYESFELDITNLKFGFPSQNIASHLFYTIRPESKLDILVKEIHETTKSLGLSDVNKKKDHAKLINHITIARIKGHSSRSFTKELNEFIDQLKIQEMNFIVKELVILGSVFKDNTTNYYEIYKLPLKKG